MLHKSCENVGGFVSPNPKTTQRIHCNEHVCMYVCSLTVCESAKTCNDSPVYRRWTWVSWSCSSQFIATARSRGVWQLVTTLHIDWTDGFDLTNIFRLVEIQENYEFHKIIYLVCSRQTHSQWTLKFTTI